ncbi:MAG: PilZ domain-containing protein [Chloroflexi bacterium]|nr:PilZ domain-containing protein [Chloroflexota bacterium]
MKSKLRMEKRRKVMTFTPVYNGLTNSLLGYLGDLTLKGALLVSENPIEVEQTLSLAIEFRKTSENPASRMVISARVAWCKLEDHRTYYNTGLEFLSLTDEEIKMIGAIMDKYQFNFEMPN